MKIVNITGGLGNQMFQYAFAMALKDRYPDEKVFIDIQHYNTLFFKKYKGINLHNGFEINEIFPNAELPIARPVDLMRLSYWIPNYVLSRLGRKLLPWRRTEYVSSYASNYSYDKNAFERKGSCYYEGYWQCVRYYKKIKDKIIDVFSHPTPDEYNLKLTKQIEKCNSVGIHVRRGDYLNEPEFSGICDVDYYSKSIDDIKRHSDNPVFYIFSNDLAWCKENIIPLIEGYTYVFVSENKGKKSCWDMFLMTYCKHLIIANSSFSWWGAYLNKNAARIYAPYPWINRNCEIDIYEDSWIKVHNS